MKPTPAASSQPAFYYWGLISIAAACLAGAIVIGMACGLTTAWPERFDPMFLRTLRPLHTLLALVWLLFGIAGAAGLCCSGNGRADLVRSIVEHLAYLLFLAMAVAALVQGRFSGREYVSWPLAASIPLLCGLACTVLTVVRGWRKIKAHSPEAAWFLLLGVSLAPLGLVEAHLYLLNNIPLDPGRDLAIQWHALDTVIAGWTISIYGIGMLLLPPPGKSMRVGWLFAIAVLGILLDFGHHNYPSPQAHYLKLIAFGATMLAVISFVRHMRSVRKSRPTGRLIPDALKHAELWTLFAVCSGVLMAVPHINRYLHGTYVVVGHSMGAMIGVNTLLLLTAVWAFAGVRGRLRYRVLQTTSICLALFVITLTGLGIARGVLRIDHDFLVWSAWLRPWQALIPISAIPLSACLLILGADAFRLSFGRAQPVIREPQPEQPSSAAEWIVAG